MVVHPAYLHLVYPPEISGASPSQDPVYRACGVLAVGLCELQIIEILHKNGTQGGTLWGRPNPRKLPF